MMEVVVSLWLNSVWKGVELEMSLWLSTELFSMMPRSSKLEINIDIKWDALLTYTFYSLNSCPSYHFHYHICNCEATYLLLCFPGSRDGRISRVGGDDSVLRLSVRPRGPRPITGTASQSLLLRDLPKRRRRQLPLRSAMQGKKSARQRFAGEAMRILHRVIWEVEM